MKKIKIYIDTSVIGGCFDEEFAEYSNKLFDYFIAEIYEPIISELVATELENVPDYVRNKLSELNNLEIIDINSEINLLSDNYLKEKIVTKKYRNDCLHIAYATYHKIDVLVSWNFKHIVNLDKIHRFNSVNLREGYNILEIRTPREVVKNEK
jgi:predicted nucleic acid-binding protein